MADDFKWSHCSHHYSCGCPTEEEAWKRWADDRRSQGKHTVGPKICVYSPHTAPAAPEAVKPRVIPPPEDHSHWAEKALTVIRQINGVAKGTKAAFLFDLFDSLQEALDRLKPHGDPRFRFQRDNEGGGLIYWDGMYRKWFYLLAPAKSVAGTESEKQYLSIITPPFRSDTLKRKIWVAMNPSLRKKVMENEMTLTEAEANVR